MSAVVPLGILAALLIGSAEFYAVRAGRFRDKEEKED